MLDWRIYAAREAGRIYPPQFNITHSLYNIYFYILFILLFILFFEKKFLTSEIYYARTTSEASGPRKKIFICSYSGTW